VRILFLLTQDIESPAGIGRYFPMARELARLGHEVTIAALHGSFDTLKETAECREGVNIVYVGQMHVRKSGNLKAYFSPLQLIYLAAKATWNLSWIALSTQAEIIHIGKPHPMNSLAGLLAKYIQRKRVLLDYDDYEAASGHFSSAWQRRVVAFFEDFVPHHVDQVTTHTYFLRDRLLELGVPSQKITYLPNGVDAERFSNLDPVQIDVLRMQLGLEGKKIVAFIGSLSSPSHPIDVLIEAFAQVLQSMPESKLLIVGGGEEYYRLQEEVHAMGLDQATCFTGRISPGRIPLYYRLADVIVDPVFDDPVGRSRLPLKLFESWVCGVPFVTGDVGDRRIVLGEPPAGILARPGDPKSLAEAILQILQKPKLAVEIQKRGLDRAQSFKWDHLVRNLDAVYEKCVSNSY
jgi:glycosyltransferase involved in cell wall biosynthesis